MPDHAPPLSDEASALLALHLVPGLGSKLTSALLERLRARRVAALKAGPSQLFEVPYLGHKVVEGIAAARDGKSAAAEVELLAKHNVQLLISWRGQLSARPG